jgi:hypothetical protein
MPVEKEPPPAVWLRSKKNNMIDLFREENMRKLVYEVYKEGIAVGKENTEFLINQIKEGKSDISRKLFGRVSEFSGVLEGWVQEKDDPLFFLESRYLPDHIIELSDEFSNLVVGREPFYQFSFPPRGPSSIVPWIFSFAISYVAGKGLDYFLKTIKNKKAIEHGKEISKYWGDNNGFSLGEIRSNFDNGNSITIEGYPENIERLTETQSEMIKRALRETRKTSIVYDAWGRVTAYQDDEYGNKLDIRI